MQVSNQFCGQAENNMELYKLSKKANEEIPQPKNRNWFVVYIAKGKAIFCRLWLFCSNFPTCILVIFYENMSKKG